jgi:ABC-type multidrug transport system fused ATPase/permease subunit
LAEDVRMVDQEIVLFEGTIAENIAMFDPGIKLAEIMAAAREACLYDEIMAKREGFQSIVKENGKNFSGGQRQRVEIARALVRRPAVIILDEATSALDPLMEKQVMDNIRQRGMTCIVIAHRLSAVRDADVIIALQYGKVIERGTHDQLLKNRGYYAKLIRSE